MRAVRTNVAQPRGRAAQNTIRTTRSTRSNKTGAENAVVTQALDITQEDGAPMSVIESEVCMLQSFASSWLTFKKEIHSQNNPEQAQVPELDDGEARDYEFYGQLEDNEAGDPKDTNYEQGSDEEIEDILADEDTYQENSSRNIDVHSEPSYEAPKPKRAQKVNIVSKKAATTSKKVTTGGTWGKKVEMPITIPDSKCCVIYAYIRLTYIVEIKIRLMVDVGGSTMMAMVTTDDSFDEVLDTVAGVLEKDLDDINLRYKPSWATKNTPVTNLANDTDWEFLLEQIRNYVLRSLSKKANAGTVPSWTITIHDGGEVGNKKAMKSQVQVSGATYRIQCHRLLSNIG